MKCKVFSATKVREREHLGERVSDWLAQQKDIEIIKQHVVQSSDREFHCLSIVILYR